MNFVASVDLVSVTPRTRDNVILVLVHEIVTNYNRTRSNRLQQRQKIIDKSRKKREREREKREREREKERETTMSRQKKKSYYGIRVLIE